jgi:hypothetical protein
MIWLILTVGGFLTLWFLGVRSGMRSREVMADLGNAAWMLIGAAFWVIALVTSIGWIVH